MIDAAKAARGLYTLTPKRVRPSVAKNVPWQDVAWMRARRAEGMTAEQIATRAKCDVKTVERWLRRLGLPRFQHDQNRHGKWRDPDWIREQRAAGRPIHEMAKEAGCAYGTMQTATRLAIAAVNVEPPAIHHWWERDNEREERILDCLDCDPDVVTSCAGCVNNT